MKRDVAFCSVFFLFTIFSNLSAQYFWQTQYSPVSTNLVAVTFTDINNGWIATDEGTILYTDAAGSNWHTIYQFENITPSKIFFRNANLGWMTGQYNAVTDSTIIFRTTDGGQNWEPVFRRNHCVLNDLFFVNDTLGWTAGRDSDDEGIRSLILHTTNGGNNWSMPLGPRVQDELYSIHFRDENYGQACGHDGLFFTTDNGGLSGTGWGMNISIPAVGKDLYSIHNAGPLNGCAVGEDGLVLFTKDKWTSYIDNYTSSKDTLAAVTALPDGSQFWAAGNNGSIVSIRYALFMMMINEEDRATTNDLFDICAVDDQHIWAVGADGTILYYNDNQPPVANDDAITITQNMPEMIFVLDNDSDPDNDELRIHSVMDGSHGTATLSLSGKYLLYEPEYDFIGKDTLQYVVTDDAGGFSTASVFIEVQEADSGPFELLDVALDSVAFGNAIWGDVDKDRDYDIIVCGERKDGTRITSFYQNKDGIFEKSPVELEGVNPLNDHAMAFVDLNMDGYLDFIITGWNNDGVAVTNLYLYQQGTYFKKYITEIPGVVDGSVDWGDYDNDGDPDLLISGNSESGKICEIYTNEGKADENYKWNFTNASAGLMPMDESVARFIHYNNDGYLDIIAMGTDQEHHIKGYVYLNDEGSLVASEVSGHSNGSIDFCDFDADGSVEILVTGDSAFGGPHPFSQLLTTSQPIGNNDLDAGIENVSLSSADWGDYDNDGDYDLLLTGMNRQLAYVTRLYNNENNILVNSGIALPGIASGSASWGDYDNDGDLDILFTGYATGEPKRRTTIYRNNIDTVNTAPATPGNLGFIQEGDEFIISWNDATDNESPVEGLTYNVQLKRKHSYRFLMRPPSDEEGLLKFSVYGNACQESIIVKGLEPGALYTCQVQAIDAGFMGSEWSTLDFTTASEFFTEQDFTFPANAIRTAEWVDADSDGKLELFIAGGMDNSARLYPVNNAQLDTHYIDLEVEYFNQMAKLVDFNNDNIVDYSYGFSADGFIIIDVTGVGVTKLNTGFSEGSFDWGDFDNDGDQDLIITGRTTDDTYSGKLFRNNEGTLEHFNILIKGVIYGDIEWVDYDSDGDLDIALCGLNDTVPITKIYKNYQGAFIDTDMDLAALSFSDMDFSDFDDDGDLDMLICGLSDQNKARTIIYKNEGNQYQDFLYFPDPVINGSCKWVDFNSDGYQDILISGTNANSIYSENFITKVIFRNEDTFTDVVNLPGYAGSTVAVGDYDGDNKIDLFISGAFNRTFTSTLFKNIKNRYFMPPNPPDNVTVQAYGDSVRVEWTEGGVPVLGTSKGFSYNLRVGTSPGGSNIMSPLSNEIGLRKKVGMGNMGIKQFVTFKNLSVDSAYFLSVQSIDGSFSASSFSDEIGFNPNSQCLVPDKFIATDYDILDASFIDYDSDQDLDLIMIYEGNSYPLNGVGKLQNEEGVMGTIIQEIATNIFSEEMIVTDYSNDNDPDIVFSPKSMGYGIDFIENNEGTYQEENLNLPALSSSSSLWFDFDNDGDEDLLIMGIDSTGWKYLSYLYRNNNGSFEAYDNLLEPTIGEKLHWVDIDNDGDKDIIRCGYTVPSDPAPEDDKFIISENMGGAFRDIYPDLPGLVESAMDFGDADNDGDMDLIYSGISRLTDTAYTYICLNDGGTFSISDSITPIFGGDVKWIDLDNDQLLDIIISGYHDQISNYFFPDAHVVTEAYLNTGNGFVRIGSLQSFLMPQLAIGDHDNDGRTDVFVSGKKNDEGISGIIYKNGFFSRNSPPVWPNLHQAQVTPDSVLITWSFPPKPPIYFNLRIGTDPGGNDVLSSLSDADGFRKTVTRGNVQQSNQITLKNLLPATTYYYAIQSIDEGYASSMWTAEKQFTTLSTNMVERTQGESTVAVYPNPVRDRLNIRVELPASETIYLELFSETGQTILSKKWTAKPGVNRTDIAIPGKGVYFLKVVRENEVTTRKIIKY